DRVVVRDWAGYAAQKNHAARLASHDWILSLDADERVTPALADEIRRRVADEPRAAAFRIPRVTWHLGRWIRSTDWYPDFQLRLSDPVPPSGPAPSCNERVPCAAGAARLAADRRNTPYPTTPVHLGPIAPYRPPAARRIHKPAAP